jgi:hypothetical protein
MCLMKRPPLSPLAGLVKGAARAAPFGVAPTAVR